MTGRPGIPRHVAEAIAVLRGLGWASSGELAAHGVRTVAELADLWQRRETPVITIGGWWDGDVPRQVTLWHLGALEDAPRRPPLRSV